MLTRVCCFPSPSLQNMRDPTKSIKEQLKSREQKQKRGAEGLNAPENNVPLEVSVVWRKFTGKLKADADKWANQIRIREEARRWVSDASIRSTELVVFISCRCCPFVVFRARSRR